MRKILVIVSLVCSNCVQSTKETQEYINAPINLSAALVATQTYALSFYSDNREGGFAGYGVFTAASAAALDTYPADDTTAATGFCASGTQANYSTRIAIQAGPAAAGITTGTSFCDLTTVTLSSGSFVAIRARVERATNTWSAPSKTQIP